MKWEIVIGLETHAQLSTNSKIFSGAATAFGAEPNAQACAVDIALPGVLPVLNREAVVKAIRFGLAVGAKVNPRSVFARKNYFYPDLPKGYQISQYEIPVVEGGSLKILVGDDAKTVRLTRAQGFGPEVKRRILIGTYVLSHGYYDAYYLRAQKLRRLIADDFAKAFERCDLIVGPTSPTTAFSLGEKAGDPVQMYLSDIYTIAVNLAGLPGMSVPCGFDARGLPVGLQVIGNYFREAQMLNLAHQYQQATDWHDRVPPGCE